MNPALIARSEFIGIENVTHLAAGGETPVLRECADAVQQFFADKAIGQPGRALLFATAARVRARLATLLAARRTRWPCYGMRPRECTSWR